MRRRGALALGLALSLGCGREPQQGAKAASAGTAGGAAGAQGSPPDALAADPRLSFLLAPQPRAEHYDVDTADLMGILETCLRTGQRDALGRARSETAAQGARGLELAERLLQEAWGDPNQSALFSNALDVVAFSREARAGEVAARALEHPTAERAFAALRALKVHAHPRWYDAVLALFPRLPADLQAEAALSLAAFDGPRAARQYAEWLLDGTLAAASPEFLRPIAAESDPATAQACRQLLERLEPGLAAYAAARLAREGNLGARERLEQWLRAEAESVRRAATEAAASAGLCEPVVERARKDRSELVRTTALRGARSACGDRARELLREACADPSEDLGRLALELLVLHFDDPDGRERALALLGSDRPGALDAGLRILGPPLAREDGELKRKAFERLREREQGLADRPFWERARLLSAMAALRFAPAADHLMEQMSSDAPVFEGQTPFRWLALRIGSCGEHGQERLWSALERESDEHRRLDLLEGFAAPGGALARERLLGFVMSDHARPYEVLFAADRLVRIGPMGRVAPVLKRAALRVSQVDVRLALQGLLWLSFPGPSAGG
jgi:hypothetical protein